MKTTLQAHAKLNLSLNITGRLENGYHTLSSVMVPIALSDTVTIESFGKVPPGELPRISCIARWASSNHSEEIPQGRDNLAVRIVEAVFADPLARQLESWPELIEISIDKMIPMGGGLGGGSADAAATLRGLEELLGLRLLTEWDSRRVSLAAGLGADIPFLLQSEPCLCEGIGDQLTPLKWGPTWAGTPIYLLSPGISVSTPWAYKHWDDRGSPPSGPTPSSLSQIVEVGKNDFEPIVFEHFPRLARALHEMRKAGAFMARMTGSGSTLFALAENAETLKNIDFQMRTIFTREFKARGWYSCATFGLNDTTRGERNGGHHRGQNFSSHRREIEGIRDHHA